MRTEPSRKRGLYSWGKAVISVAAIIFVILSIFRPTRFASADPILTVQPITWNVVGLDSNNVNVGPNNFPVGARVCNTGTDPATNVTADFVWTDNTYAANIYTRPGSYTTIPGPTEPAITIDGGNCRDFYFEVEVLRDTSSYRKTRAYRIDVSADGGISLSTPTPREIYVEYLISQSRNSTTDVRLDGSPVDPGGTMTLMVGSTYTITLYASTATNGYEQIETFINFPNTIFQVNSVTTTYTANDTVSPDLWAGSKLYADGCAWENDPNSPKYRACLETGKYGGVVVVAYDVTIIGGGGSSQTLNTLIYDFSGASYHYNSDFSVNGRIARIVNAGIEKSFAPKTILPGGTATLTFTLTNPGTAPLSDLNFTDLLPAGMTLSGPVTTPQCGGTVSASVVEGRDQVAFSGGTLAAGGTCEIQVAVTATAEGLYTNTSGNLFIGTADTEDNATDYLQVTSLPPAPSTCGSPVTLATWNFTTNTNASIPNPAKVAYANATYSGATSGVTGGYWYGTGEWQNDGQAEPTSSNIHFQFDVDTSNFGGVGIQFQARINANGNWKGTSNNVRAWESADSAAFTLAGTDNTNLTTTFTTFSRNATSTGTSHTRFRIQGYFSHAIQYAGAEFRLDNVTVTGCPRPEPPTLSKAFLTDPITVGGDSLLRFSLANPNSSALSGVEFSDILPEGLVISSPNGLATTCSFGTGPITAVPGTQTTSLSGVSLAASETCTITVSVRGETAGQYHNVSDSITSIESGPNTTASGYGEDDLTVVAPPVIGKAFGANAILTGDTTSLTFSIYNPNTLTATALTSVGFVDTLPAGLDLTPATLSVCAGTNNLVLADANPDTVTLAGVSLDPGDTCTFSVDVTGTTAGLKSNQVQVTSTNGGAGNTAEADLLVRDASPGLDFIKQVGLTDSGPWSNFLAVDVSDDVYYRFVVENTGDATLTDVTVTDPAPFIDPSLCVWEDGDGFTLADTDPGTPGVQFTLPVADADEGHLAYCVLGPVSAESGWNDNTAEANSVETEAAHPADYPVSSTASYATTGLTLAKSADRYTFLETGEALTYEYLVTNSGYAPLHGPVTVSDDRILLPDEVSCQDVTLAVVGTDPGDGDNFLDPGESITCTATYTITAADLLAGSVTNTASASADGVTSNSDSVTVNRASPGITVEKSISVDGGLNWMDADEAPGPDLSSGTDPVFRFVVTNSGDVTLTDVWLSDTVIGAFYESDLTTACTIPDTLAPDAGFTCYATLAWAAGQHSNTATVQGTYEGLSYEDSDNAHYFGLDAAIHVIKSSDTSAIISTGQVVPYTFTVTNTGNVTLTNITVSDPNCDDDPAYQSGDTDTDGELDISETWLYTCDHTVTQAEINAGGDLSNTVTANSDESAPDTDTLDIPVTPGTGLEVTKSSTTTEVSAAGQVVPYTFTIANIGSTTLTNVTVSDPNCDDDPAYQSGDTNGDSALDLSETWLYTCDRTVTQAEIDAGGDLSNTVTANSDESAPDTDTLDISITQSPAIQVVKSSTTTEVTTAGQVVPYTFTIANIGSTTLTNVTVSDPNCDAAPAYQSGDTNGDSALDLDETWLYTCDRTVTQAEIDAGGNLSNTVTANSDESAPDTDTLDVPITQSPAIQVVKSSTTTEVTTAGQVVPYTFTVTNTGNVTLTNITVSDPNCDDDPAYQSGDTDTDGELDLSETWLYTCDHTVTQAEIDAGGDLSNTVTTDSDESAPDTDTLDIPIIQVPGLTLIKDVSDDGSTWGDSVTVEAGDTVYFRVRLQNTGNLTLTGLTVDDGMAACTLVRGADAPGDDDNDFEVGETWVYTCSITAEAGAHTNTATADSNETGPDSDGASYFGNAPLIGVAKRLVGSPALVSAGTWDVTYEILVRNYGNVALDDLQVSDDLTATFPPATTFTSQALTSADFTVNPAFDGDTDTNLLAGTDSLAVGADGTITLVVRVVPASSGPFENTSTASAQPPSGDRVADDSQDGANPDPDSDGDPTNNNDPTDVSFGPNIFDPPIGIKLLDPSGQPILRWTMFWINNSNIVAVNARVSDPIPAGATYNASGLPSGYPVPGGAPAGSTNAGVSCTDTSPITETTLCYYEGPTGPYPRGRIIWAGTLGPDLGATDAASAAHEIAITFYMTVNSGANLVQNVATIDSDLNGDGDTDDPGEQQVASAQAVWDVRTTGFTIPPTGFAPGRVSLVPQQPADSAYANLGSLWLEIPSLGLETAVVGVPRKGVEWDVSWLWDQAGWLEGTAFPTTPGNSAITSHVYRADGQPGPFVNLRTLRWGDRVIVHANGQRYVYEVRDVRRVLPGNSSVFRHEEYTWLTLITCQGYNPADNSYRYRTVVRAVLISVEQAASRPASTR